MDYSKFEPITIIAPGVAIGMVTGASIIAFARNIWRKRPDLIFELIGGVATAVLILVKFLCFA